MLARPGWRRPVAHVSDGVVADGSRRCAEAPRSPGRTSRGAWRLLAHGSLLQLDRSSGSGQAMLSELSTAGWPKSACLGEEVRR